MNISGVIKKYKFHPYLIQMHQELYEIDFHRRIEFCLWVPDKFSEGEHFLDYILSSEEPTFHNNGLVNGLNSH